MLWKSGRLESGQIAALTAGIIMSLIFSPAMCIAQEGQSSSELALPGHLNLTSDAVSNTAENGSNATAFNGSGQNYTIELFARSENLTQIAGNQSLPEFKAHVYVYNNDNDGLDVSLLIDSELRDTKEVSSKSESEFDVYPLKKGRHSFVISWWDEDVKKSFDVEEIREIENETSVNLYTIENEAPEKREISVDLANENQKDLKAYLYIDGSFEKSSSVSKESTSNLGEFELEDGVHELSVKWQDPDTRIEYEKRKTINIGSDEVVIFRAPVGISFEAGSGSDLDSGGDLRTEQTTESIQPAAKSNALIDSSGDAKDDNETDVTSNDSAKATEKLEITQSASEQSVEKFPASKAISAKSAYAIPADDNLYLYSVVVFFALYLLFFRR